MSPPPFKEAKKVKNYLPTILFRHVSVTAQTKEDDKYLLINLNKFRKAEKGSSGEHLQSTGGCRRVKASSARVPSRFPL